MKKPAQSERAAGTQGQLLKRVLGEQFEVLSGQPAVLEKEKVAVVADATAQRLAIAEAEVEPAAVDLRAGR